MTIIEFFDPKNKMHVEAYKDLQENGYWPNYFVQTLPKDLKFPTLWQVSIGQKLADCWVEYFLKIKGFGCGKK